MTSPSLLEAAKKFVDEHPYSLKRAPETFAGELAAWASSMVEAERERALMDAAQKARSFKYLLNIAGTTIALEGLSEDFAKSIESLRRPTPSKGERA